MYLISCHVDNFGKLQDYSLDFSEGLNQFCYENGAGKSTLAIFIRVMFYSFEGDSKRDELANERKRYMPWQGGIYGGNICFFTHGKRIIFHFRSRCSNRRRSCISDFDQGRRTVCQREQEGS